MRSRTPRAGLACMAAASTLLLMSPLVSSVMPAAATPVTLPEGTWPTCADADAEMCVESISVTVDGEPVDYVAAGLTASVTTLQGTPASFNWSLGGAWDRDDARPQDFDTDLLDAQVTLVVRTGTFVPRLTTSLSRDLRITTVGDDASGRTLTLTGKPIHIDWDPSLSACYGVTAYSAGTECGDDTTKATAVGTGWRFMGNTQDMGGEGWSDADRSERGGMYVATDAQGGPHMGVLALQFLSYPERYWSLTLGNPHLDVNDTPVTGSFTAWLPGAYFTAAGSSVEEALATGFTVSSMVDGVETVVTPTVSALDGGILISLDSIGYSIRTLEVRNEAPPVVAPNSPTEVKVTGGSGTLAVGWTAPMRGTSPTSYVATAYTASRGGSVAGSCSATAPATTCTIRSLNAGTLSYVSVVAKAGDLSSGPSLPRVAARTLPTRPTLTASTRTSSSVSWTFPRETDVTYTATAKRGATSIAAARIAVTSSGSTGRVTVSGQEPGVDVTVTVTATYGTGSISSAATTRATLADKPGRVSGLAAGPVSKGEVALTWSASAANGAAVTYRYRWAQVGKAWSAWASTERTRAMVSGWVKGRTYKIEILARNSAGDSDVTSKTITA